MTLQQKHHEKTIFRNRLIELLTENTTTDKEFFMRLLWALEQVSIELGRFEDAYE